MTGVYVTTSVLPNAEHFDNAKTGIQDSDDGHIAWVAFPLPGGGQVQIQCHPDGANTLADGLDHLAAKVRAAHRDWLRGKAAEHAGVAT